PELAPLAAPGRVADAHVAAGLLGAAAREGHVQEQGRAGGRRVLILADHPGRQPEDALAFQLRSEPPRVLGQVPLALDTDEDPALGQVLGIDDVRPSEASRDSTNREASAISCGLIFLAARVVIWAHDSPLQTFHMVACATPWLVPTVARV